MDPALAAWRPMAAMRAAMSANRRRVRPVRLHILSDLHLEHGAFTVPTVACDV